MCLRGAESHQGLELVLKSILLTLVQEMLFKITIGVCSRVQEGRMYCLHILQNLFISGNYTDLKVAELSQVAELGH